MVKASKAVALLIITGILVLTGCSTETKKFLGEWEGYDGDYNLEFTNSDTVYWDGDVNKYEFEDGKLMIDSNFGITAFDYTIEDDKLVLSTVGDKSTTTYLRVGQLQKDEEEMKKLQGEWGVLTPLFTFTDEGNLIVSDLRIVHKRDEGSYIASNGIIRYEPNSDVFNHIYFEYEFDGDALMLSYASDDNKEPMKLVKMNTDKVEVPAETKEVAEPIDYVLGIGMDKNELINLYGKPSEVIDYQGSMAYKYGEYKITYFTNVVDSREVVTAFHYYGEETLLGIRKGMTSDKVISELGEPISMGEDEMTGEYYLYYNIDSLQVAIRITNSVVDLVEVKENISDSEVFDDIGLNIKNILYLYGEPSKIIENPEYKRYIYYDKSISYYINMINEEEVVTALFYYGEETILGVEKNMTCEEVIKSIGEPEEIVDGEAYRFYYNIDELKMGVTFENGENGKVKFISLVSSDFY